MHEVLLPNQQYNPVSTHIHSEPPISQLPEAAGEIARQAADAVKETTQNATSAAKDVTAEVAAVANQFTTATRDAANRATETAKDLYQAAALKTGDTIATSKDYVRRNPVPVVLGAVAFGVAIGYLVVTARRKPTFGERYADEPMAAMREAIVGALAPMAQRVHEEYGSARDGAGKIMDRLHGTN
ncbi:MAG: hypothetical protein RLZZ214_270, partial [Verrucomicrobiota bacterium]